VPAKFIRNNLKSAGFKLDVCQGKGESKLKLRTEEIMPRKTLWPIAQGAGGVNHLSATDRLIARIERSVVRGTARHKSPPGTRHTACTPKPANHGGLFVKITIRGSQPDKAQAGEIALILISIKTYPALAITFDATLTLAFVIRYLGVNAAKAAKS
jgi:hypothetical protein